MCGRYALYGPISKILRPATGVRGAHLYFVRRGHLGAAVMKHAFAIVALASLASLATVGAADSDPTAEATAASREWLSVVDAGQYGQSWEEAAALFKHNITKSQWELAVGDVRKQTGALK